MLATIHDLGDLWQAAWNPLRSAGLHEWRDFWLQRIFDDRFLVCYYAPLMPLLLLLRGRGLRVGIVATALVFLGYLFGVLYAILWLLTCLAFYRLGQWLDRASREDPGSSRPVVTVWVVTAGWFLISRAIASIDLPQAWCDWMTSHAPWVYPIGARGWIGEPYWLGERPEHPMGAPLLRVIFFDPHLIGTAFLAMRLLHYFSELRRGSIPRTQRGLLHFLAFTCYAPTLIQGPIERFDRFQSQIDTCHQHRGWHQLPPALGRIAWGLTKGLISTLYFVPVLWYDLGLGLSERTYYRHPEQIDSFGLLYFGVFLQIFALYLEFSGYCDVAIGLSRLLGYRVAENFDWPWLATSLRQFWRRWHITLSMILRDYVYIPLGGNRRHTTLNLCLTFVFVGLWHAPTVSMLAWGVLTGLLLAVNQRWSRWVSRLDQSPLPTGASEASGRTPLTPGTTDDGLPGSAHPTPNTTALIASANANPGNAAPTGAPTRSASNPGAVHPAYPSTRASDPTGTPAVRLVLRARAALRRLSPLPQVLSWLLTMHAFVFSLVIFFGGLRGLRVIGEILRRTIAACS